MLDDVLAGTEIELRSLRKAYQHLTERLAGVIAVRAQALTDEARCSIEALEKEIESLNARLRRQSIAIVVLAAIADVGSVLAFEGHLDLGAAVLLSDLVLAAAAYRWLTDPDEMPWPFLLMSLIPSGVGILAYFTR